MSIISGGSGNTGGVSCGSGRSVRFEDSSGYESPTTTTTTTATSGGGSGSSGDDSTSYTTPPRPKKTLF